MTPAQKQRTEQEIVEQERKIMQYVTRRVNSQRALNMILATETDPRIIESEQATHAIHEAQDNAAIERYIAQIAVLRDMVMRA
jgi:hypothetical protein